MSSSAPRGPCRPPNGDGHDDSSGSYADDRKATAHHIPLKPTVQGMIITDTIDAMLIVQCCLDGVLSHVARRPGDKEREKVIVSGNIFCYEENASGIKRWTDGINWSPSRILGNCLVYRELCEAFPPGEKKKALKTKPKRNNSAGAISRPGGGGNQQSLNSQIMGSVYNGAGTNGHNTDPANDPDRKWIGSLVDTYRFKEGGLIKKTISFQFHGVTHHVVSYYTLADAKAAGTLARPIEDHNLFRQIAPELWDNIFRTPLDQELNMFDNRVPMHDRFLHEIMRASGNMMLTRAGSTGMASPQFHQQFPAQFHPHGVQVQQFYTPSQQHLPQQYRPEHHAVQSYHIPGPAPMHQHQHQYLLQSQAAQFHHEGTNNFPDAPLNDPTKQHQQHHGHYMVSGVGHYSGHPQWQQAIGQQAMAYQAPLAMEEEEFDENDIERSIGGHSPHDPSAWPGHIQQ